MRNSARFVAIAALAAMSLVGCGGSSATAPIVQSLPKFYAQSTQNVVLGPFPQLLIKDEAAAVAVGTFVRVMVDSGEVHDLKVLSSLTTSQEPYIEGTWVSWPAGDYKFTCSVSKPGANTDLVLYLTIQSQTASAPFVLVAADVVGKTLTTETKDGRSWFVGEINQPIRLVLTSPSRGGIDPITTSLRVSVAGTTTAPSYEFDDPADPMRLVIHQKGEFLVEVIIGLSDGIHAVLGSCWLRLV
ncbi:MAG: hypothetical protein Q7S80_00765 [bacterium]|nr:hypothetical protein [bacterium]